MSKTNNVFLENLIKKYSTRFTDNIHVDKETTLTVEKKPLDLVLPCLGSISLQSRTLLNKSLKIIDCCKMQMFESKTRSSNNFYFKDRIPRDLGSGAV